MTEEIVGKIEPQKDPRAKVYDLLGGLDEKSRPYAIRLFVMGGGMWMSDGYFFENASSSYLHGLGEVVVSDEEGNEVGRLDSSQVFSAFYVSPPEWLKQEKRYKVSAPQVQQEEIEKLREIRDCILERLWVEGRQAGEEFALAGLLLGGKKEDFEQDASKIATTISEMIQRVDQEKK